LIGSVARRVSVGIAVSVLLLGAAGCTGGPRDERVPEYYPADYGELIRAAEAKRQLLIWSTTDQAQIGDALDAFQKKYPKIRVEYREMRARNIYQWFLTDLKAGRPAADFLLSSAMDMQIKLVNDGYAASYASPERDHVAKWANWKSQAWGITAEPIVMLSNRSQLSGGKAPVSHFAVRTMLEQEPALNGRVVSYDPTESAFGYLILSQDEMASPDVWRTVRALGMRHARFHATTKALIDEVSSGRATVAYNVLGSYAADAASRNPNLLVTVPEDYTLIASRIGIIPAKAPHSEAAALFLDFLLSREGQSALGRHYLPSVRGDVPPPEALRLANANVRAIRVGPALLVLQDQLTRRHFLTRWDEAVRAGQGIAP
jgi:iron(III) transport system substrate-binding protein